MKIKKYISILLIILLVQFQGSSVFAFEIPSAPTAPSAPESTAQAPTAPSAPEAPEAPTLEEVLADSDPIPTEIEEEEDEEDKDDVPQIQETISQNQEQEGVNDSGNVGDTAIDTGNANTTGALTTLGNTNVNSSGVGEDGNSVGVINSGNGTDSTNTGSVSLSGENNTFQDNSAVVGSNLSLSAASGDNTSDNNVGNTAIDTGNANTTATVITGVNTNVDGIMVSEFNIADDHIGDIVLDFGAGCVFGCGQTDSILAQNSDNGSNSTNNAAVSDTSNTNTFQTNDASIESNLTLDSDSGNNSTSANTGGNSTIETGDANVGANLLTFVNNNVAGNVVFGVVNIFGELVGDIFFPESALSCSTCGGDATAVNSGNGSDSTNNTTVSQTNSDSTFQYNDANIENNLVLSTATGGNEASGNTNGNSTIETGDSEAIAQVLNIANMNVVGGDMWLVLVNEAGQWIGKILGASDGANYAGSTGTEFAIDENGEITAINSGNGSGSDNNSSISQNTNNTVVQTNTANVVNNLNLSANTGGNTASNNTGGDSKIKTGDAKIIANVVNFVNNNIVGNGRLFVTVVNVFGSWMGDFVTPESHKENNNAGIGGEQAASPSASSNNQPNNNSSGGSSNSSSSSNNSIQLVSGIISGLSRNTHVLGISAQNVNESQILGANNTGEAASSQNKKVTINLAWVILFVPILLTFFLFRKRFISAIRLVARK